MPTAVGVAGSTSWPHAGNTAYACIFTAQGLQLKASAAEPLVNRPAQLHTQRPNANTNTEGGGSVRTAGLYQLYCTDQRAACAVPHLCAQVHAGQGLADADHGLQLTWCCSDAPTL